MPWLRPGLDLTALLAAPANGAAPRALDTALFDIDGVLIEVARSYRLAVMSAAETLVRRALPGAPLSSPLIQPEDIAAFKRAGGFNNDWDLTQTLAALWVARLREWRATPQADVPLGEWAARASAAAREGRGGVAWLVATVPASAIPEAQAARWAHDEYYWGAELVREVYAHMPEYAPDAPGFVHNEEALLDATLLPALRARGLSRFGLITGRVEGEVGRAVALLARASGMLDTPDAERARAEGEPVFESAYGRSPFGVIVPAALFAKPDPRALAHALDALGSRAALYVGDTADDLDLVLRYRRETLRADPTLPPTLAVMIASDEEEIATYRERGADVILAQISELPVALDALTARGAAG